MKKILTFILAGCLVFFNLSIAAAHNPYSTCFEETMLSSQEEVVVEVDSKEEFFRYPKNPNYRYIFIINEPSITRTVCYMCGSPNMGTVTYREQIGGEAHMCPTCHEGNNDIFSTYRDYSYERCNACGYQSDPWPTNIITYAADCLNGDMPWHGRSWEVKYEYTQSAGYNLHQSLRWWTEYSYL